MRISRLLEQVQRFFASQWDEQSPLLLGYSGGPDSKALLYALLESGALFHVAHVDHGWREESAMEAKLISEEMERLGIPFYQTRLTRVAGEAEAREDRLAFFRSLFQKHPFQALLLAHHGDDLAETTLKRVFEGSHLPFLGGMQQSSILDGMPIFRPLLTVSKKDVLDFLEKRNLVPFIDPTNEDPSYLRARLRQEVFPFLEKSFGKKVKENLQYLSERSYELQNYLDQKTQRAKVLPFAGGLALCLQDFERIEQRHLLHTHGKAFGLVWTRVLLETVLGWALDPHILRQATLQGSWIAGGRGWVLFSRERKTSGFLRGVIDCQLKV
jgi:tRNA(Ile)-lysidine synthetase-like protein